MSRSLDSDVSRLDPSGQDSFVECRDERADAGARLLRVASPPEQVHVRPATESDHTAIRALLDALELEYPARHLPSFVVAEGRFDHGPPTVFGIAELKDFGGARLLSCVGVREDLQGLGLGRVLVERALDRVTDDVWLYTLVPGFFAKLGFVYGDAPPERVPPRRLYGCDACHPERCHRMVRRGRDARTKDGAVASDASLAAIVRATSLVRPDLSCDLTPAALWIWRDCETPRVRTVAGHLCILLDPHHEAPYWLEPLGRADDASEGDDGDGFVAALEACLRETGRVSRVRGGLARRLPTDRFDVTPLRDHFDYVCDVREIAALRGPHHDGKRNQIRKFARQHPRHEVRPLTSADRDGALALFDRWGQDRTNGAAPSAPRHAPAASGLPARACQRRAIERAFEDFGPLGLTGAAVVEDGASLGFLVASRVGETAFAHFLYADAAAPGVYQTLLVEACRTVLADAAWVNLEEDLGLPGLRRTKLSWQPARLVEKFAVRLR
jgi:N-acetylglutamate synthase-like GNAT family acetyltransferase